jgi:branched-chain amino acid transport system ATP-binding protein
VTFFRGEDLAISFGGLTALDGVSFEVRRGEVVSIIGPNGAGKTTLFNLVSRLYPPSRGRLIFENRDITGVPAHRISGLGIARTFQNIELFEHTTVLANLLLGRHPHRATTLLEEMLFMPRVRRSELRDRQAVEEIIEFLDLEKYRDSVVASLPFGVRKVVELGRACATEPRLLLLDEPSSGLNVEETDDMATWIHDIRALRGITVLVVEHDMRLVSEVSDRVVALHQGRVIAEGTPSAVQNHPQVVQAYLGGALEANRNAG